MNKDNRKTIMYNGEKIINLDYNFLTLNNLKMLRCRNQTLMCFGKSVFSLGLLLSLQRVFIMKIVRQVVSFVAAAVAHMCVLVVIAIVGDSNNFSSCYYCAKNVNSMINFSATCFL